MSVEADQRFMALALTLGRRGLGNAWPNPAVGAVVVKDGVVVGRGWTQPGGRPHAEVEALRRAGAAARGATLYATLEPCSHHGKTPPCVDAIAAAGIARVVSALEDPNPEIAGQGHARLTSQGIAVATGVCSDEARRAHAGHISRVRDGRPHVTLKLAVSADGKAGLAGRKPAAITGELARECVQRMRAMNDAVVTGIGTVLADDPQLTCRLSGMEQRSPVRVVLDSALRTPVQSRLAASATRTLDWVSVDEKAKPEHEAELSAAGVEVLRVPGANGQLDLAAVMRGLAGRGVTRVMVEAGPILAAAFLEADLVDEAALFCSPNPLGADGIDALEGLPLTALTQSPKLRLVGSEQVGADALQTYERRPSSRDGA
jgi:diaminohydroxyphosphoribosylaminopyrimidine deaminase / 5-amino-6-(5-phosphoribosylamino)uracil reductase